MKAATCGRVIKVWPGASGIEGTAGRCMILKPGGRTGAFSFSTVRRSLLALGLPEVPLSLPKMLSGANAFEISDIERDEHRGVSAGRLGRNNVTCPAVTRNNNSPGTGVQIARKEVGAEISRRCAKWNSAQR